MLREPAARNASNHHTDMGKVGGVGYHDVVEASVVARIESVENITWLLLLEDRQDSAIVIGAVVAARRQRGLQRYGFYKGGGGGGGDPLENHTSSEQRVGHTILDNDFEEANALVNV